MTRYRFLTATLASLCSQSFSFVAPRSLLGGNRIGCPVSLSTSPSVAAPPQQDTPAPDVVVASSSLGGGRGQIGNEDVISEETIPSSLSVSLRAGNPKPVDPSSNLWTRELWLDLRGTSLLPSEASTVLRKLLPASAEEQSHATRDPWDKVLLSEEMFRKAATVEDHDVSSLIFSTSNGDLVTMTNSGEPSTTVGKSVSHRSVLPFDPLLALDVTSKGGWLLLNGDGAGDGETDSLFVENVGDLVEFLASIGSSAGDLSLPSASQPVGFVESVPPLAKTAPGGIAVRCPSESTLVRVNTALAKSLHARQSSSSSTSTASGIWVPSRPTESTTPCPKPPLRTAMVLHLDVQLWASALEFNEMSLFDVV